MSKREERQMQCIKRLVQDILSDKSITQITYEHRHGVISVLRETPPQTVTHAIGFTADYDEEETEE